ncbi:hypothetical protein V496_05159 [Pseudogymnoascus sp. VKM F-4515 (FW-2607)]|nr:hypothetical protein V496_05159 [Pseudogymnoascus sp. VKM F-4515 (FW-2607)]
MEGTPLFDACEWLAANPSETVSTASRIFKVPQSTTRSKITRAAQPARKLPHGGQNRVLSTGQTEALKTWITEQYHLGLGANRHMIYRANELKADFHFITTKPIAQQRTKAQQEPTVIKWFKKYTAMIRERSINPMSIWNMDETGFRVGIPGGERILVPRAAKNLYTTSPENRTSITIIEAVSAGGQKIPPVLVIPACSTVATALHRAYSSTRPGKSQGSTARFSCEPYEP